MGRRSKRARLLRNDDRWPLVLLTLLFLLGGLVGCWAASWTGDGTQLTDYIRSYLLATQAGLGDAPSFPALIWDAVRYPLAVLLLGGTALGMMGIPVVFVVRGFLLSFAIASFVRMFGGAGLLLAAVVFGMPGAFSLPALFVLGVRGWRTSCCQAERLSRGGRRTPSIHRSDWSGCGISAVLLLLCVLVERVWTVRLLAALAGHL